MSGGLFNRRLSDRPNFDGPKRRPVRAVGGVVGTHDLRGPTLVGQEDERGEEAEGDEPDGHPEASCHCIDECGVGSGDRSGGYIGGKGFGGDDVEHLR